MSVITSFTQNLFSGQGEFFMGKKDAGSKPSPMNFIGNSPKIEVQMQITRRSHKESTSGNRLTDKVQTVTKGGRLVVTMEDILKKNLAAALQAATVSPSGTLSGSTYDTFATVALNDIVKTQFYNLSSVVIKDSAGSPATLVNNTDYKILDAAHGLIQILNLGSYVQPFRAQYAYAATDLVPAFTAQDDQEYQCYAAIANTEGNPDQRIGVEIYRVTFDPAKVLALINDQQGSFDLEGEILRDPNRASDANYGGFLRWAYVDANS